MAIPNPLTSPNASKLHYLIYDNAGINAASMWRALRRQTVNLEEFAHAAMGSGIVGGTVAADEPGVLIFGSDGTVLRALRAANATPGGTEYGLVVRNIPSGTQPISGSVSITGAIPAGANNIGDVDVLTLPSIPAGANNIGDVDVLTLPALPTGANVIGGVLDEGWDNAGKAVQRGLAQSITAITEQTLLTADAANLYNVHQIVLTYYSGSVAPAAMRTIKFRLGAAGTVFHTGYVAPTANVVETIIVPFPKQAVRSAVNQAITVQLDAALGTAGEYSALLLAYKSAS